MSEQASQLQYASFLVRMWRPAISDARENADAWHGEVEHIQSGWHASFSTLAEMLDDLRAHLLAGDSTSLETR